MAELLMGTQGWGYDDWEGNFYPHTLPKNKRLVHYSSAFQTVENWARLVPNNFIFSVKVPKIITHEKVLEDCETEVETFLEHISLLGDKLGAVLFQFSYDFKPEKFNVLKAFISNLPDGFKYVVEVRNRKWLFDDFTSLLRAHNIALAQIDHPWFPKLKYPTADFAYIRWLGDRKRIESDFSRIRFDRTNEYQWWAEVIRDTLPNIRKLYAYMNNHYAGHSPTSLRKFQEIYGERSENYRKKFSLCEIAKAQAGS